MGERLDARSDLASVAGRCRVIFLDPAPIVPEPIVTDLFVTDDPYNWSQFNQPVPVFILYPDIAVRFGRATRDHQVDPRLFLDPFWQEPAPQSEIELPFEMEACIADGQMGLHWRGLATRSKVITVPAEGVTDLGVGMWNWAQELIPQIQELAKKMMSETIIKAADDRAHTLPGNRAQRRAGRATPHLLG